MSLCGQLLNELAVEEEGADAYFKPLVELAKELDPQKRPVTIVTHLMSTPETCKVAELVDVLALNVDNESWYVQSGDMEAAKIKLREELNGWGKRCPRQADYDDGVRRRYDCWLA